MYIQRLASQLQKAKIHTSSPILDIVPLEQGYRISSRNTVMDVDHLIIATNISCVKNLIAKLTHAQKQKTAIDRIDYFNTTIAVHGDKAGCRVIKKNGL